MNDINRRKMNDVIVPRNEVVRRTTIVPEQRPDHSPERPMDRIERNPFFEQRAQRKIETKNITRNGSGRKGTLWALMFAAALTCGFVVANHFATATIEVTPISRSVVLDETIVVPKDGDVDELVFNTATLTEEMTKKVSTTEEKKIQTYASGKIRVFNEYSTATQPLLVKTRFESSDRKTYRINKSVDVPGMKVVNGKNEPGFVDVSVYAVEVGDDYNLGLVDKFTIPGFKGDPRYSKFWAKSLPDFPIEGGFDGIVKVPSEEVIAKAKDELKQDLMKIVVEKLRAQIPESSTFFPGSLIVNFEEVPQKFTEEEAANVSVRAVSTAFFFDEKLLTQKLVTLALPEDDGKVFTLANMSSLIVTFVDPVDSVVLSDVSRVRINIKGDAIFAGQIDSEKIISELVGKNKKDFGAIIGSQSNIHNANATIRPVWKTVFPTDSTKISVKVLTK